MFKTFYEKYMSSAAFRHDANNDNGSSEKTPAELAAEARGNIKVDVSSRSVEESTENNQQQEEENSEEENEEEEGEEEEEENSPPENETEEQKQDRLAKEKEEKEAAKAKRKEDRVQRRIDKAVAAQKEAETELAKLRAQLQEKPVEGLTEEEVERRAQLKADEAVKTKEAERIRKDFEKKCDDLQAGAIKVNKEFDKNVNEMASEIGAIPEPIIYILSDLDNANGAEVLEYLAKPDNIDEMEEIYKMSVHKATTKLVRLSDKLKDAKKAPPRKQSAVPPPVNPIAENGRRNDTMPKNPTQNMDEFIRIRNKQIDERRKAKGY